MSKMIGVYHVTYEDNLDSIREHGLLGTPFVWVCTNMAAALMYVGPMRLQRVNYDLLGDWNKALQEDKAFVPPEGVSPMQTFTHVGVVTVRVPEEDLEPNVDGIMAIETSHIYTKGDIPPEMVFALHRVPAQATIHVEAER